MREEIDTCGYCTLRTFAGITVRSIQPGCPEHSGRDSTGPRRVRTQVERDADGVAWRQTADTRPGFATYPQTAPGDPSWWRRSLPCGADPASETEGIGEVTVTLDSSAGRFLPAPGRGLSPVARVMAGMDMPPPVDGETCAKWCGYCHLADEPERVEQMHAAVVEAMDTGEPVLLADGSALITPPRRRWWHRLTRRA